MNDFSVLDYNWTQDIDYYSTWIPHLENLGTPYQFVEADPNDILVLSDGEKNMEYHVHKQIWYHTIDAYLIEYYHLNKENRNTPQSITLDCYTREKLVNYLQTASNRRKPISKLLRINFLDHATPSDIVTHPFDIPGYAPAEILNALYHWLWFPSNAKSKMTSIYYDGLIFRPQMEDPGMLFPIPSFTLMDYIEHELYTGISLSIEISAILLEISNSKLRKKALDAFAAKALAHIVRSDRLFFRIAAARNFFQQIILESSALSYKWNGYQQNKLFSSTLWEEVIEHAQKHIPPLYYNAITIVKPPQSESTSDVLSFECDIKLGGLSDAQKNYNISIQDKLNHLEALIQKMKKPVDLVDYVRHPMHGLAIFCNPNHPNVNQYLQLLEEESHYPTASIPRCKTDGHDLFMEVHEKVQKAIQESVIALD